MILIMVASACRDASAPLSEDELIRDSIASSGAWSLEYTGTCVDRAPKLLDVTFANGAILFDDYILTAHDDGNYVGSQEFSIYLESCRRDVLFNYEYSLMQEDEMLFSGIESITEIGVGTESCPIQLVYVDPPKTSQSRQ